MPTPAIRFRRPAGKKVSKGNPSIGFLFVSSTEYNTLITQRGGEKYDAQCNIRMNHSSKTMKTLLLTCLLFIAVDSFEIITLQAQTLYSITADNADIGPLSQVLLTDNGRSYANAKRGGWNLPSTYVTGAYSGKSLKISLPATTTPIGPEGYDTDRFEYILVHDSDINAPRFGVNGTSSGEAKYTGFAFRIISSQTDIPNKGVIVFQAWQGQGTPYSPPIWLEIRQPANVGGPWGCLLWMKDDTSIDRTSIQLYSGTIPADQWYKFVIGITPNYAGGGRLEFWVNGVRMVNYFGRVGFTPESRGGYAGVLDAMQVKFGAYRSRPNPKLALGFDNIRYGKTYLDVAP